MIRRRTPRNKPHWMFALNTVVRNAIEQGVSFLTPETDNKFDEPTRFFERLGGPIESEVPNIIEGSPMPEHHHSNIPSTDRNSLDLAKSLDVLQSFFKRLALELEGHHSHSQASTVRSR